VLDAEEQMLYCYLGEYLYHCLQAKQSLMKSWSQLKPLASQPAPFIIGLSGGVASGKTTLSKLLKASLQAFMPQAAIDIVSTDHFLHPNAILKARDILDRKGFPESYNYDKLFRFLQQLKSGQTSLAIPVYTHDAYDVSAVHEQIIHAPDVVILEGINVLQRPALSDKKQQSFIMKDFLDISFYVEADETSAIQWYLKRITRIFNENRHNPDSYFHQFNDFSIEELHTYATDVWHKVNSPNLSENIVPSRAFADIVFQKNRNHQLASLWVKKY
jgi:type I pantothenate kinase